MEEYKGNSFASKQEERPKGEMIVSAPAKIQKKNANSVGASIANDVWDRAKKIGSDVVLPNVKNAIVDMVVNGLNVLFYGDTNAGRSSIPANRVSYRSYYDSQRNTPNYSRPVVQQKQTGFNFDDVILTNRGDAELVIQQLNDTIARYGFAKVADLYEYVGLPSNYTDNNYGWTDLRYSEIIRQRDGYLLKLPRPLPID